LNYGYSLVFITPYILIDLNGNIGSSVKRDEWKAFLGQNLKVAGKKDKTKAYESLGWNGYLFIRYDKIVTRMAKVSKRRSRCAGWDKLEINMNLILTYEMKYFSEYII